MKIHALNCNPDLSWLTQKGLKIELTTETITESFPLKYLFQVKDSTGSMVDLYTPDVGSYLESKYPTKLYDIVMVGWDPRSYGPEVSHTGGYTCPISLLCGTRWITVRQDTPQNNIYPVHEMMHAIGGIINIDMGDRIPKDFMDVTPVNGQWLPYYENDYNNPDPLSNFNQTWKNYLPFLDRLNNIVTPKPLVAPDDPSHKYNTQTGKLNPNYIEPTQIVVLTRTVDDGVQTLGELLVGSFSCKTLERPWKGNQVNISCIPKGTYHCSYTFSLSHLNWTYALQSVPGRSGIRIHSANYYLDLEGCIGLGSEYRNINGDSEVDIINSKITVAAFETYLGKKDFTLIIK